jgi:hypothetical protein
MTWFMALSTLDSPFGVRKEVDNYRNSFFPHVADWSVAFPGKLSMRRQRDGIAGNVIPFGSGWLLSPAAQEVLALFVSGGCLDRVMIEDEAWMFFHVLEGDYLNMDESVVFRLRDDPDEDPDDPGSDEILEVKTIVFDPILVGDKVVLSQRFVPFVLIVHQSVVDVIMGSGLTGLAFRPINAPPEMLTIYNMRERFDEFLQTSNRSVATVGESISTMVAFREAVFADPQFTDTDRIEVDWATVDLGGGPQFVVTVSRDFSPRPSASVDLVRLKIRHRFPVTALGETFQAGYNNDNRTIEELVDVLSKEKVVLLLGSQAPLATEVLYGQV